MPTTDGLGEEPALFFAEGDHFVPTPYCQGPWSPDLQFGGAAAALLAEAIEAVPTLVPQRVARLTVDLMRPVPMRPLTVRVAVEREGKRISLVGASLYHEELEVARATALRMRVTELGDDLDLPTGEPRPGPPPGTDRPEHRGTAMAGVSAFAYERPEGLLVDPTWVQLLVPVVAGRPRAPLAELAYVADFGSGVGHPRGRAVSGINADITLNVVRYPTGGWICLTGQGWTDRSGIGQAQVVLSDGRGVLAAANLARLVDRLPTGARPPLG